MTTEKLEKLIESLSDQVENTNARLNDIENDKLRAIERKLDSTNINVNLIEDGLREGRCGLGGLYMIVLIGIAIAVFFVPVSVSQATVLCFITACGTFFGIMVMCFNKAGGDD